MIYLPRCATHLAGLAATGDTRYAITHVRVRETAGAAFRVEATDGKVLGILRGPSSPSASDREAAESLPETDSLALEALLPRRGFLDALKGLKGEGRLGVRLSRHQVLLASGDSVTRLDNVAGRFPDVDAVLPRRPAPVSIRVDPALLVRLLRAAGAVAKTGESVGVEILYWTKDTPVGVIARGADGVTFDGLVMPLT